MKLESISSVFSLLQESLDVAESEALKALNLLGFENEQQYQEQLAQNHTKRREQTEKHIYVIQNTGAQNSLSFLFTPFIYSVLNFKTVYITSRMPLTEQVFAHYFRLEALELQHSLSLSEMNISLELVEENQFQFYAFLKALLDPYCHHIDWISSWIAHEELTQQLQQLNIRLNTIVVGEQKCGIESDQIDFAKLLWKRKNTETASICEYICKDNAPLVSQHLNISLKDAERLVDDLMYSEHLFEKFSVFGEFTETVFKQHNSTQRLNA
ncbi:hypothetical protein CDG60_09460 [Acinetobacter chinensis]|uniref:Uncharacterized protein n=1 Tax=Acinetobacter chinensis TaxID=2004650 RepID=A0A3B7LV75_9GAMM|nr:hypothetical protein [Acinetobacter chinensis]AXY56770.1 hypothetical protein CDG60_09460 [Acinetobacter chinensis]